jgi:hypothetical protein
VPRFLRRFPQASTRKSRRPQLLHNGETFFYCGARHSAGEWVQRIRGKSQSLPNDVCGDAGGSRQFSRVNCRGKFGNARECGPVARALRPPLQPALWSGLDRWPPQGRQKSDSQNRSSAASTGKSGTPCERCRTSYRRLAAPSDGKARREIHERCGSDGWSGPHLFFAGTLLARDWRGSARMNHITSAVPSVPHSCPVLSVLDLFSQGFHRIAVGFTASAQIHLAFRFVFAYPSGGIRPECCAEHSARKPCTEIWRPLTTASALFPRM